MSSFMSMQVDSLAEMLQCGYVRARNQASKEQMSPDRGFLAVINK